MRANFVGGPFDGTREIPDASPSGEVTSVTFTEYGRDPGRSLAVRPVAADEHVYDGSGDLFAYSGTRERLERLRGRANFKHDVLEAIARLRAMEFYDPTHSAVVDDPESWDAHRAYLAYRHELRARGNTPSATEAPTRNGSDEAAPAPSADAARESVQTTAGRLGAYYAEMEENGIAGALADQLVKDAAQHLHLVDHGPVVQGDLQAAGSDPSS
jgi:hypothetical protein